MNGEDNEEREDDNGETRPGEGHTEDIYECRDCSYQGHAVAKIVTDFVPRPFGPGSVPMYSLSDDLKCAACGSREVSLFFKKPPAGSFPGRDREAWLTEQDPDWKDRFGGDVDIACDFYRGDR